MMGWVQGRTSSCSASASASPSDALSPIASSGRNESSRAPNALPPLVLRLFSSRLCETAKHRFRNLPFHMLPGRDSEVMVAVVGTTCAVDRSEACRGARGRCSAYPVDVVAVVVVAPRSTPPKPVTAFLNPGLGPYLDPSPPPPNGVPFPPPAPPTKGREGPNEALARAANRPAELWLRERSDARREVSVVNDGWSR